ncbi:MAG: TlpA family protein disulfide reductase [Flavobacteriales bacterium]|nr:TlpA family protein disulfide reductase [Flavobacteriales bacterium]
MRTLVLVLALMALPFISSAQKGEVPSVMLKDLKGATINSSEFDNDGKPYIINFWATWCSPCKRELNNIAEVYEDWVDETGVKLIAVSIDDTRTSRNVKPYVNASAWEYEIFLDENGDFRGAMNVAAPPYTFLVDGDGKIVYEHIGYNPGDEEELYEKILELVK